MFIIDPYPLTYIVMLRGSQARESLAVKLYTDSET